MNRARTLCVAALISLTALLAACSSPALLSADKKSGCAALGAGIDRAAIGLPTSGATIDSATLVGPSPLSVAERGPTPAALVTPATPEYCRVLGRIAPTPALQRSLLVDNPMRLYWGRAGER